MVLVTGGTGLVGSHLLFKLVSNGIVVKSIYRNSKKTDAVRHVFSYYSDNFQELFNRITWIKADINDVPSLIDAFKDVTHVYHCAALISFDPKHYHQLRKTNIEGTANIVNLCISHTVEKLCYVSSIAAIGNTIDGSEINEETPWNPEVDNSVYAITKYGAEMEVWRGTQEGLNTVIVNPGLILGPGFWNSGSGFLFKRIHKGMSHYTTGTSGYVDVQDVVNIMMRLMQSDINNEGYIVISENLSFESFAKKVSHELQVQPPKKEARKMLLQMAWRLDWLRQKLTGKARRLTKQTAYSAITNTYYNNTKVKTDIDYTFKPLNKSIEETCAHFLSDL